MLTNQHKTFLALYAGVIGDRVSLEFLVVVFAENLAGGGHDLTVQPFLAVQVAQ